VRSLSSTMRAGLYSESSGHSLPVLLSITHGVAGYPNPLLIVNNTTNLVYSGNTYIAFPFKFDPPDIRDAGEIANARLTISAIDQQIAAIVRSTDVPPTVIAHAMFYTDETGSVYFEPMASWEFVLRNVGGNAEMITADLIYEERLDLEFPVLEFRPNTFPGLF